MNSLRITSVYPTVISLTTIPSRMKHTVQVVDKLLKGLTGFEKIIVNIPRDYKDKEIWQTIRDPRLLVNITEKDYGPITKLYPVFQLYGFAASREMNLLILDDNEYHLESLKRIAERQDRDHNKSFTYYKYDYKGLNVPQGVDIISFWYPNLRNFVEFYQTLLPNKYCRHVDDLVIGKYLNQYGIAVEQLDRKWKWVWKPNPSETTSLFMKQGKYSRDNSMKHCFNTLRG